jgi:hydroxyethylthiazole kinase-like uncharacterized protein yjeF
LLDGGGMPRTTTMNGLMALLRVGQMAEADRLTVAAGIPAIDMMDHAGAAVAREIARRWTVRPVIVLSGPGNNGGDGFVAAWHLLEAGWPVRVALLGTRDQLKGEAHHHAARWTGAVEQLAPQALDGAALVVDALFGSGLGRKLEGPAADTLAAAAARALTMVAVDVPSGVMGDTGEALGAVAAVLTVTFTRKKPGHLLLPGRSLCGEVVVADIGTASSVIDRIEPDAFENDPSLWVTELPRLNSEGNKHTRGGPRRGRPDDDRGARGRTADLRRRADQHHGPAARQRDGFCRPAVRRSLYGFPDRTRRGCDRGDALARDRDVGNRAARRARCRCVDQFPRRARVARSGDRRPLRDDAA